MFEQACRHIDRLLRTEVHGTSGLDSGCFREYLDGLAQDKAAGVRLLLERLDLVADDASHGLVRYLFAAATSERLVPGRHFLRVATVDPGAFLTELAKVTKDDWGRNGRHKLPVQRETRSIELATAATRGMTVRHDQHVRLTGNAERFPYLMGWLRDFASGTGRGSLQLARIVKLQAGGQVYRHVDAGLYYLLRDRYHLVLQSRSGSRMQCERQTSTWHPGEVWWFNNHVPHQAFNDSDDERIHVIFDVLPDRNRVLVPYLQQYAETGGK